MKLTCPHSVLKKTNEEMIMLPLPTECDNCGMSDPNEEYHWAGDSLGVVCECCYEGYVESLEVYGDDYYD